ncbi:hypothetical protein BLNAU_19931 [Blattamonas nauphoetae]|uniref:Uncharacterized protein n=1 Tax=Blattamonas nauphoetae TaxID=2049346 RepID=A0ABQ9X036_9EUKA|nr:hypothetical protein BLNAU_19931 [Blattamonas nauphoetae]
MTSSEEYSPFLNWNPQKRITAASVAQVFISLASMVRDDYKFDLELLRQCTTFLSSIKQRIKRATDINDFLKALGQDSPNPASVFVDSITMLLSSPHPSIVKTMEKTYPLWIIISNMSINILKWKEDGAETAGKGRILLQALEQEGFQEEIEKTLLHDMSSRFGSELLSAAITVTEDQLEDSISPMQLFHGHPR